MPIFFEWPDIHGKMALIISKAVLKNTITTVEKKINDFDLFDMGIKCKLEIHAREGFSKLI